MENSLKKRNRKGYSAIFLTLTILIMGVILSLPSISAADWDNIKEINYEKMSNNYPEITIRNSILGIKWLPLSPILDTKITTITSDCITNCYSQHTINLKYETSLVDDVTFKDEGGSKIEISYSLYTLKKENYTDKERVETETCKLINNKTSGKDDNVCAITYELKDVEKERLIEVPYELKKEMPIGSYELIIKAKKQPNQKIDYIFETNGVKLDEMAWFDSNWGYRKKIYLNTSETQLNLTTTFMNITWINGKMNATFSDLRFTDSNDNEIGFWFFNNTYSASDAARVAVNTSILTSANNGVQYIWMYYGNVIAETKSNISTAFYFGDDFNSSGANYDTNKWGSGQSAQFTLVNNQLHIVPNGATITISSSLTFREMEVTSSMSDTEDNYNGYYMTMSSDQNQGEPRIDFVAGGIYTLFIYNGGTNDTGIVYGRAPWLITIKQNNSGANWVNATNYQHTTKANRGGNVSSGYNKISFGTIETDGLYNIDWVYARRTMLDEPIYYFGEEEILDLRTLTATQSYPANNYKTSTIKTIGIGCNFTASVQNNISSVKVNVYNSSNSSAYTNTETADRGISYNKTWTTSSLINGNYSWACYGYGNGGTNSSTGNRSFEIAIPYLFVTWESYPNSTVEGSSETIIINVTTSGSIITQGNLIYNGTSYTGTVTNPSEFNYSIKRILSIPNIFNSDNYSFYWSLITNDSRVFNTTIANISVMNISAGSCSTYKTPLLNLSLFDEKTKILVNNNNTENYNSTIDIDLTLKSLATGLEVINYSVRFTNQSQVQVCIQNEATNTSSFRLDAVINYFAAGGVYEFYHIQNFTVTNNTIPQIIGLYDLASSQSQEFLITFKDASLTPISGALIDITRYYVGDGLFRTVEVPKTDDNGQTMGHFVLTDVIYTIIIKKEGQILATFDNVIAFCEDVATGNCRLNLNAINTITNPDNFDTIEGVSFNNNFNTTLRRLTTTFTSDGIKTIVLNATKYDRLGTTQVCSDTLTSASGTLICNVPNGYGNVTVVATITADGVVISKTSYSLAQSARAIFGTFGYFLLMLMFICIVMLFASTSIGVIIASGLVFVLAALMNIFTTKSFWGTGSTIALIIIACILIIWKIASRSDSQ